jgi:hypothetical protein
VKFFIPLAIAGLAIWFFGSHAMSSTRDRSAESADSISNVAELLDRAGSGKPLDGRPAPTASWVRQMTSACVKRERRLAALPRVATASGIADRGAQILTIHRAYAARVSSLRPPVDWEPEVGELRAFNAQQQRILQRVVAVARSGDVGRSSQEAVALRELAGRANTVFLRLRLDRCTFGASGMPL